MPALPDHAAAPRARRRFRRELAAALDGGDVAAVQLRLKDADDEEIRRACAALRPVVQDREVAVHSQRPPRPRCRARLRRRPHRPGRRPTARPAGAVGDDAIVGVTCHDSRHLAMEAAEAGRRLCRLRRLLPHRDQGRPRLAPSPICSTWWSELMTVPCVAIGGITLDNCRAADRRRRRLPRRVRRRLGASGRPRRRGGRLQPVVQRAELRLSATRRCPA